MCKLNRFEVGGKCVDSSDSYNIWDNKKDERYTWVEGRNSADKSRDDKNYMFREGLKQLGFKCDKDCESCKAYEYGDKEVFKLGREAWMMRKY